MPRWFVDVSDLAHIPVTELVDGLVGDVDAGLSFDPRVVWELAERAARAEGVVVVRPGDAATP